MHDGHEEKQEEKPGAAGPDFFDTSALFVRFENFVVQSGFRPKLRERNNQTQCGQIEIKNIHDDLTAGIENGMVHSILTALSAAFVPNKSLRFGGNKKELVHAGFFVMLCGVRLAESYRNPIATK